MAKKKVTKKGPFDANKFLKMVSEKATSTDFEKAFGYKTPAQIKAAHYKAMVETGQIQPAVIGKRAGRKVSVDKIKIGKSCKISLPKDMVDCFGFKEGDEFTVKLRAGKIITLKKVGADTEAETEEKPED